MSRPSKNTRPAVGCSRRRMSLAVVVFPQPDSPTRASVSPCRIETPMPSTALTDPTTVIQSRPSATGKCLVPPSARWLGSACIGSEAPAIGGMAFAYGHRRRVLEPAHVVGLGTAGSEPAAGGQVPERGWLPGDRGQPLDVLVHARHRAQEGP